MSRSPPWNQSEIDPLIALYLTFRVLEDRGAPYVKAQFIRELIGAPTPAQPDGNPDAALANRTKGSAEAKMMNVTAALESIGRHDLSMAQFGYVPLSNMQAALKARVTELVAGETLASLDRTLVRLASNQASA